MKRFFISIVFLLCTYLSNSQNFEYSGPVTKELIYEMEGSEILLYLDCLEVMGETNSSISWISTELSKSLKKDIKKYRSFIVSIDTENPTPKISEYKGKKKLSVNKYFIHIRRNGNFSLVELYQLI